MSIATKIQHEVDGMMKDNVNGYRNEAIYNINGRGGEATESEIKSELDSIWRNLLRRELTDAWTIMFRETIEQANSSFTGYFVESMVTAIFSTHKTIQSEFWLNMLKVMESVAKAEDRMFDPRNAWTKDFLARMIFAYEHSAEVDVLRSMSTDELSRFRLTNGCNAR